MSNLQVKDAANTTRYLAATGTGTDGDPFVPEHEETNSAAILAALGGTLTVDGPLTDTQLRANPLTVTTGGLTDTQLRAAAVPVSGSVTANPTPRTLSIATGTAAASGDNTLIAAPGAGLRAVLVAVQVQLEAGTATVGLLKDGAGGAVLLRWRGVNDGDGVIHQWPMDARPRLTAATALVLNLSGANQCGYTAYYYTEAA